ncbi:DUF883 family protein [Nitratireductor basaltis]|uniref:DUF883 domain-containing protein n=1 Tax=Nitratireductor basaltis TaxID=472175 RepID=A0A084U7E8_9HYPH|nr:hypothetical protein [Nitratireductor basaltis]KFB08884.1 hypothetical protein EL18_03139 [Nitratireductor basaltis]
MPNTTSTAKSSASEAATSDARTRDLESDIQRLRDDISQLTAHLKETGDNSIARATDAAKAQVNSIERDLENRVREKPLHALAMAAGAGFFLAMMFRR